MFDLRKLEGKAKKAIKKADSMDAKAREETKVKKEKEQTKRLFGKIKYTVVDGVKVVNIIDWVSENLMDDSEKKIFEWCQERKAYFYSKPSSDFSLKQAISEAKEMHRGIVLVEQL